MKVLKESLSVIVVVMTYMMRKVGHCFFWLPCFLLVSCMEELHAFHKNNLFCHMSIIYQLDALLFFSSSSSHQRFTVSSPRSRCRSARRATCLPATTWLISRCSPLRTNQRCSAVRTSSPASDPLLSLPPIPPFLPVLSSLDPHQP